MNMNQPFHLVKNSPWPLLCSFCSFSLVTGLVKLMSYEEMSLFFFSLSMMLFLSYQWWRDISWEGSMQGHHTSLVMNGLYLGMILFIISEIFFFFSFFWAFFHMSLSSVLELGYMWPPVDLIFFDPYSIPLLNSIVLLSSGVFVTWSHYGILSKSFMDLTMGLSFTVFLGGYFSFLQWLEYKESFFCLSDGVYGSVFFVATGFHGLHVIIGSIYLVVSLLRSLNGIQISNHHVGLELSIWYWHFVDVVWLFLYSFIYWWGS